MTYDNDEFPLNSRQGRTVFYHHFVACANHRKSISRLAGPVQIGKKFRLTEFFPVLRTAMVHEHGDRGSPFLKLGDPIRQGTKWCNNDMRAKVVFLFAKQADDADGLNGFSCLGQFSLATGLKKSLPRPISSARMPLMPCRHTSYIQVTPSNW